MMEISSLKDDELSGTFYRVLLINLRGLFKTMFGKNFYHKMKKWHISTEFYHKMNYIYGDECDYKTEKIQFLALIK